MNGTLIDCGLGLSEMEIEEHGLIITVKGCPGMRTRAWRHDEEDERSFSILLMVEF